MCLQKALVCIRNAGKGILGFKQLCKDFEPMFCVLDICMQTFCLFLHPGPPIPEPIGCSVYNVTYRLSPLLAEYSICLFLLWCANLATVCFGTSKIGECGFSRVQSRCMCSFAIFILESHPFLISLNINKCLSLLLCKPLCN